MFGRGLPSGTVPIGGLGSGTGDNLPIAGWLDAGDSCSGPGDGGGCPGNTCGNGNQGNLPQAGTDTCYSPASISFLFKSCPEVAAPG